MCKKQGHAWIQNCFVVWWCGQNKKSISGSEKFCQVAHLLPSLPLLAVNLQKGLESPKRPRIPEKAQNLWKGPKSPKKATNPQKGPKSLKRPQISEKALNPWKRPWIPEKAPNPQRKALNPQKDPESLKKALNLWKRLYSSHLFAPLLSSPFTPPSVEYPSLCLPPFSPCSPPLLSSLPSLPSLPLPPQVVGTLKHSIEMSLLPSLPFTPAAGGHNRWWPP